MSILEVLWKIWLYGIPASLCLIIFMVLYDLLYDLDWFIYGSKSKTVPNVILNCINKEESYLDTTLRPTGRDIKRWEDGSETVIFNFEDKDGAEHRISYDSFKKYFEQFKNILAIHVLILAVLFWPVSIILFITDVIKGEIRPFKWLLPPLVKIQPENILAVVRSCTAKHHFYHRFFRNKFCVCGQIGQEFDLEEKIIHFGGPNYHKIKNNKYVWYVYERDLEILTPPIKAGRW